MEIDHSNKTVKKVVNEQFKYLGLDITFADIEEEVQVGKKKIKWYHHYRFENEQQYLKWKEWAIEELKKVGLENEFNKIDMIWGFTYKWKEGS